MNSLRPLKALAFQRLRLLCPDLKSAVRDYQLLLGVAPCWVGPAGLPDQDRPRPLTAADDVGCAWFVLGNTILELLEASVEHASLAGLVLTAENIQTTAGHPAESGYPSSAIAEQRLAAVACRNLWISMVENPGVKGMRLTDPGTDLYQQQEPAASSCEGGSPITSVDHIVLHTNDADDCIRLFGDGGLGIRLALDKNVPEWGGRMLFFRVGKLTLEIIEPTTPFAGDDFFWGIAFRVDDIQAVHRRLSRAGVSLSQPRKGRKPGTWVVTVNSHQLGIPTLLLQG
ncbi:hypothetical protein G8770_23135 [Aestuariicella hydrocarbonica]|uniref:VOC domain-containing protein n=1 Tax=Pseudomaricurvus hydrocarbonicus TaxID=1470433 RepID=A0A9E5MQ57_9GAMM|nr:VOC family protein [Aestuariicella hydrocarbonica]NHO68458.1 hypothetical protein [Aestuariicella hydrocarbonica]